MKRRILSFTMFFIVLLFSISPVCAFADEINNPVPLSITSGLNENEEGQEATFDDSRMVYGETVPFADITVTICRRDGEGIMLEDYRNDFEVGSLGIFSMTLPLKLGTNYIEIMVSGDDYDEAVYIYELKRKPQAVKDELKSMIALPGLLPKFK
ncbi:hypothetical protein CLNEO_27900 [Anaerotignum neopropionicum]|uniref:Ig-like domain-containing protein n=1 Tax=Anaerotignum neopropionicum TaxID=36847 RepID=A0A136WBF1_9FIRM|nr:hypothetical protein [Anaerotignum neopropionicum]KXL51818.1 hypothetical protein CLNEO_27900 [Anaerotignum neopropionicum]